MEKITFIPKDSDEEAEFFVLEQTRINGVNYILVTIEEEGDGDAFILKDLSDDADAESLYEIVSDDTELNVVSEVFEEMLEDVEFER